MGVENLRSTLHYNYVFELGMPVFAFAYTTSDVHHQLSPYLMVDYYVPVALFGHI